MTSKVSSENVSPMKIIGDDLNYHLVYNYSSEYAHRLINVGNRYYQYDANGNIVREKDGKFDEETVQYGRVINQETENVYSTDYGWGLYNDETSKTYEVQTYDRTYKWNARNQLISSIDANNQVAYVYGQDGQRTNKYTTSSETVYFNKMWTLHTDSGNSLYGGQYAKNIYLGDTRIVTKLNSGKDPTHQEESQKQYYYHSDHLGSASLISDYNGKEYQRIEYTPYGETWVEKTSNTGNEFLPYKFTGKEIDEETGLYYYGARYLDPKYSLWISTDPALGDYIPGAGKATANDIGNLPGMGGAFNHINFNLYHYAGNNPVKYSDPDGNFVNLAAAGIGALIGASTGAIIAACSGASGREIAAAAVGGAVTGGLAGFTCGASLGVQIAGAALAGTAGYCAENLVAGNEGSVEGMAMAAVGGATGAMAGAVLGEVVSSIGNKLNTPQVHIDSTKYPETAQHIKDAQNNGYPSKLTIDRAGAKANRAESLRGYNKVPGKQLDEYPPAMFKEGGRGADIRAISPKDNMGAGASMGNQLRNYPDGTVIKMVVD